MHDKTSRKKHRKWSSPNPWCTSGSLWGMQKRKVQETSFPNFKIKGKTTTQFGSFWPGQNASSLHWQIQVYCHLLRQLLIVWGYVLPQEKKWWVHCIQTIQSVGQKTTRHYTQMQMIWSWRRVPIRASDARLIGYSDSDWVENRDDRHSTSGDVFLMANGAISWVSQQQKMDTLSVGEPEYMELTSTGWQAAWLKSFSREIGFSIEGRIPLCSDNQATIFLTINPAVEHQTKHIDIQHHYIQEQYKEKVIEPFHVAGEENPADLFTKSLPVVKWRNSGPKLDCHRHSV